MPITSVYLSGISAPQEQETDIHITRYYTNDFSDTYTIHTTFANKEIALPIYSQYGVTKVIISIHLDEDTDFDFSSLRFAMHTNQVTCYYTLKIIDILLDGENEISRTIRSESTAIYKWSSMITVSSSSEYPENEYEVLFSVNQNISESNTFHIYQDTTVCCYYKRKYSKNIFVKMVKKILDEVSKYNIILKE